MPRLRVAFSARMDIAYGTDKRKAHRLAKKTQKDVQTDAHTDTHMHIHTHAQTTPVTGDPNRSVCADAIPRLQVTFSVWI